MIQNTYTYLKPGDARYTGAADDCVAFTLRHQLLDRKTWRDFVEVFRHDSDDYDRGWRCEFFGKMMRGACLTYAYSADEELYAVLESAARDLLTAQREDGRFSTYSKEKELHGWDIWGRKYVLTGLLHFYRICKDEKLKEQILAALCRHADALIREVGPNEGQVEICRTSNFWLGVNSASVLEPIVDLYKITGERRYLDFASYIVSTGGCSGGDLIALALEGKKMPYEYPEVKAYETMSFFEGVLAYYEVTGEEKYFEAVKKFTEAVAQTDVTVIGCSGCTHELFDHSSLRQAEYSEIIMQETCVTVTWMRLLSRLYLLTGEKRYMDRVEVSALNALYGAVNTGLEKQYSQYLKIWLDPFPFDSYSPLYNNKRGVGVGGYKEFAFGGGYGCCACIASAGTALFPLDATVTAGDTVVMNFPLPGTVRADLASGGVRLSTESFYPARPVWETTVGVERPTAFTLLIREPCGMKNARVLLNGEEIPAEREGGYLKIRATFRGGERIAVRGEYALLPFRVGERTAFLWGPLVLARDSAKEEGDADLTEAFAVMTDKGRPGFRVVDPKEGELLRMYLKRADGGEVLLTDYASCGKKWRGRKLRMTVFMNIRNL